MSNLQELILIDDDYFKALLTDINNAKESIDLEAYIFENDSIGKQIADALCNAAKRGVKVRVLVDGVGSLGWGSEITTQMEHAGIETRIFHPLPWKIFHWSRANDRSSFFTTKFYLLFSKINSRNHRKTCIIDGNIVFIGSANIIEKNWRDTTVKIINTDVAPIQYAFDKAWGKTSFKKRFSNIFKKKLLSDTSFHLNYSWRLRRQYYKLLLNRISKSQNRIWIVNSYFVPNNRFLKQLTKASQRGVDVKIILPKESDIFFMTIVSATYYSVLLKKGVKIYEYTSTILHAKMLILDDWFCIGSTNLNNRSFLHDLEIDVEITTPKAQQIIEQQFKIDLKHSREIQIKDINNQAFYKKWLGKLILLLRYWL